MTRYALGLGSNVGDRRELFLGAVSGLSTAATVVAVSSLYETEPVGGPEQDPFLNAVAVVDSDASPEEMLAICQKLEQGAGRVRVERWGPRTLDLDILVWENGAYLSDILEIPHPRAHQRGFVLRPLVDVWPEAVLADGLTAADSLRRVGDQGVALVDERWTLGH